jgi:hypothetical protein
MFLAEPMHVGQDGERHLQSLRVDADRISWLTVETHSEF